MCFDIAKSKISTNAAIPAKNYGLKKNERATNPKRIGKGREVLGHFNTGRSSMKSRLLNTVGGNVYRIVNARIRHMMTSPKDLFKVAVYGFSDFAKSVT